MNTVQPGRTQAIEKNSSRPGRIVPALRRLNAHMLAVFVRYFQNRGRVLWDYFFGNPKTVTVGLPPFTSGKFFVPITLPSPEVTATYCTLCAE